MKQAEDNNTSAPVLMYQDGLSMKTIWAVPSAGIDPQTGQEIYIKKDGTYTYTYSANDMVAAGNSDPKYRGTGGFTAEYKGIGLSATISYLAGCQMYNSTLVSRVENANIAYNVDRRLLIGRWTTPGQVTPYKKFNSETTTRATTRFVQDRRELSLSSIIFQFEYFVFIILLFYGLQLFICRKQQHQCRYSGCTIAVNSSAFYLCLMIFATTQITCPVAISPAVINVTFQERYVLGLAITGYFPANRVRRNLGL